MRLLKHGIAVACPMRMHSESLECTMHTFVAISIPPFVLKHGKTFSINGGWLGRFDGVNVTYNVINSYRV